MANRRTMNRDVFDLVNKVSSGDAGWQKKPIDMGTREGYDPEFDANWQGDQADIPGTGEGQFTPGQGYGPSTNFSWGNFMANRYGAGQWDFDNMNDAYDYWNENWGPEGYNPGGFPGGPDYSTFLDWWLENDQGYTMEPGAWDPDDPQSPGGWTNWSPGGWGGGGPMGGAGDLGWGSMFAGGAYQENITNPFGEGWGPEGQYGEGENYEIDPDWNPWGDECYAWWQQSGAADSYEDFAAAMCG